MYDGLLNLELPTGTTIVGFADDVAVVATAKTADLLELVANETLRRASMWLKENGLKLAVHKTESVLVTHKRRTVTPEITLEEQVVPWSKTVRYLGVHIDNKVKFNEHIWKTTEKTASTVAALARLMPNIGGPQEMKRRLLNSVVHSKLLYGAEVWAENTLTKSARQRLASVQRRSAIRITSAYRTISENAVLVLAATPPIDLLAQERREIYLETKKCEDPQRRPDARKEAKKNARIRLLDRWQQRWMEKQGGRWTKRLIPDIRPWVTREHGEVGYHLTQALSDHGAFRDYLLGIGIVDDRECIYCGEIDNAEHILFYCRRWQVDRQICQRKIGEEVGVQNLIAEMLRSEDNWKIIKSFVDKIITEKEKEARTLNY